MSDNPIPVNVPTPGFATRANAMDPRPRMPIGTPPPTNPHPSAADANAGPSDATQPRHPETGQYQPKGS